MAELQESLLQQQFQGDSEEREAGDLAALRFRSGSTPGKTIHAFTIDEAGGSEQSRRRERHMVKRFGRAFGEAFRLVLRHHRATLLWFTVMSINTFASAFGALADESRFECSSSSNLTTLESDSVTLVDVTLPSSCGIDTSTSNTATPGSQAVYGLFLILFVCIGMVTIVLSTCLEERKGVAVWVKAHFVDVMVVIAGTVYLAGANLSLVASLDLNVCVSIGNNLTMLNSTFRNVRNYLVALAFLISIIPDAFKKYWNVLSIAEDDGGGSYIVANNGNASDVVEDASNGVAVNGLSTHHRHKSKKTKLHYLILQGLFQMLSYMVHLDELYIIIQDEVSSCDDDEEGRSCPTSFVAAGVVSYAIVSLLWVGITSVLVCKYAHDLDTAKIKRRQRSKALGTNDNYSLRQRAIELCWTRKHLGLFLFWLVLAMYIPTYLALNNSWPWICVTRCQLQACDASNDGREERCMHYFIVRIVLLFLLGFGTVALLLVYWCVVLLKETDREGEEEEEEVVDACCPKVQETEDPGSYHELAVNSSQSQSE